MRSTGVETSLIFSVLILILGSVRAHKPEKAHRGHESEHVVVKMKEIGEHLEEKHLKAATLGHLLVNGPLPPNFAERFSQAVSHATGTDAGSVKVMDVQDVDEAPGIVEIKFHAHPKIVDMVENEAADGKSKLATGSLHSFLVAKEDSASSATATQTSARIHEATPVQEKGIDVDTQMPYGELEAFGREDTAQELTEDSVTQSDAMVDQLERAEVAEEKRSVFRALTRLRGAAITSFDGVARSQTGNIDAYNKVHKWRNSHPLHHLADEESDISKWAFPDNADLLQTHRHK